MIIIPAMDIINGACVRLTKGDYSQKTVYNTHPLDVAKAFEDSGFTHLHLVDLDGAKNKNIVNLKVLETIANKTNLIIDMGGGIQSNEAISSVFNAGASMVTAGSIAVNNPNIVSQWLSDYGAEKIILGADTKDQMIAVHGWENTTKIHINEYLASWQEKGMTSVISTDIAKDGMLQGPAVDYYKALKEKFPDYNIIASGGVSSIDDLEALKELNIYGTIVGKAIYENTISLKELSAFCGF